MDLPGSHDLERGMNLIHGSAACHLARHELLCYKLRRAQVSCAESDADVAMVIVPNTPPLESTTGRAPHPQLQSSSVTAARLVVVVQLFGEVLIKSRTIICTSC